jgi:hypothetical protein
VALVRGSDTLITGWTTDEILVEGRGADEVLLRAYTTNDRVLGSRTDSIRDRRSNLAPVSYRSRGDRGEAFVVFSTGKASGWLRDMRGDSSELQLDMPAAAINAASFDLVLRSSPLAAGFTGTWQGVIPQSRAVATLSARVTGSETMGGEQCWRVEATIGTGAPTFWIGQQSRTLRQMTMQIAPGVLVLVRAVGR